MSQEISKVNVNNVVYDIKDAAARAEVEKKVTDEENGAVNNALNFTQGLKINGAEIINDGDTVTFK